MKTKPIIYVAGPYSSNPVKGVRDAVHTAGLIWKEGGLPYIPHLTMLADLVRSQTYDLWLEYGLAWVLRSDALLRIPGDSNGSAAEERCANKAGIPVFHPHFVDGTYPFNMNALFRWIKDWKPKSAANFQTVDVTELLKNLGNIRTETLDTCCKAICEYCKAGWPRAYSDTFGWFHYHSCQDLIHGPGGPPPPTPFCEAGAIHDLKGNTNS